MAECIKRETVINRYDIDSDNPLQVVGKRVVEDDVPTVKAVSLNDI